MASGGVRNSKNDQNSIANDDVDDDDQSFETPRKIILMSLHQVSKLFLGTTSTQKIFTRNVHIPVKKNLHQENNVFVLK